jgi:hypothetical protein
MRKELRCFWIQAGTVSISRKHGSNWLQRVKTGFLVQPLKNGGWRTRKGAARSCSRVTCSGVATREVEVEENLMIAIEGSI